MLILEQMITAAQSGLRFGKLAAGRFLRATLCQPDDRWRQIPQSLTGS